MAKSQPRLSLQGIRVLHALLEAGGKELAGAQIAEKTDILSGTLYPLLIRYKDAGWVTARWEDNDPAILGRPKRRFYRITGAGQRVAAEVFSDAAFGSLSWGQI